MVSGRNPSRRSWIAAPFTLLVVAILAILTISGASSAHLPIYASGGPSTDSALKIPDANVSYGLTAEFSSSTNRIQFYAFSVEAGHVLSFQLSVPAISSLENFAPVVVLLGPGLPAPDSFTSSIMAEFNIGLSSGSGATGYVYNGTENVREFEPFTQVNLWDRQNVKVTLPSQAVYYLAVAVPEGWAQDATSGFGKYVLAPGLLEKFSILDYMAVPLDWMRWHSFWEDSVPFLMIPTFLVVIAGTCAAQRLVKKRRSDIPLRWSLGAKSSFYAGVVGATLMMGSAINQLLLLFGYTRLSFEPADYIELMLQTVGFVLGLFAFRMSLGLMKPRSGFGILPALTLIVLLAFAALAVGAGWIVGPVLFACGGLAELMLFKKPKPEPVGSGS